MRFCTSWVLFYGARFFQAARVHVSSRRLTANNTHSSGFRRVSHPKDFSFVAGGVHESLMARDLRLQTVGPRFVYCIGRPIDVVGVFFRLGGNQHTAVSYTSPRHPGIVLSHVLAPPLLCRSLAQFCCNKRNLHVTHPCVLKPSLFGTKFTLARRLIPPSTRPRKCNR